jgi:hypothetical protein
MATMMYKWIKNAGAIKPDDEYKVIYAEKAFKVKRFLNFVNVLRNIHRIDNKKVENIIELFLDDKIDLEINETDMTFNVQRVITGSVEEE